MSRGRYAWLLVAVLAVGLASFGLQLHTPGPENAFNGNTVYEASARTLLVIAHPDDECMFFGPTVQRLQSSSRGVHLLCLSTGNAGQLGALRTAELAEACKVLKVPLPDIEVLDHAQLQDGHLWEPSIIAGIVFDSMLRKGISQVVTFDEGGVSGHHNHRSAYLGVRQATQRLACSQPTTMYILRTEPLAAKFTGPLKAWAALVRGTASELVLVAAQPWQIMVAMSKHSSQFVWYRRLFIVFSSYSYMNALDVAPLSCLQQL